MKQFMTDEEAPFRYLEERARNACIRFSNQQMPPGCDPDHADVGFEINEAAGTASLLVSAGISYRGESAEVRTWLDAGRKQFTSFRALREWIRGPLAQAYDSRLAADHPVFSGSCAEEGKASLTDMSAVSEGIKNIHNPLYLDETLLFERMRKRVLGQDAALKGLAAVMFRHCARRRPARPAVVFAVGPSGVGKTKTAEGMAEVLREFNDENNGYQFLRLDMTEYQEAHRISQLIGAPQGYTGHGEGSQLLDALKANPKTVILFDEIEKAHPSILRVLMNAMDAGRLSTSSDAGSGREIDCRHSVFMFTSNLDAGEILEELRNRNSFGNRSVEDDVCRRRLHAAGLAPEIVGRIGRFLVFRPLSTEKRAEIMALSIAEIGEEYGIRVDYVEPEVVVSLMQKIRSESFGVRPARFLIDDLIGEAFAAAARSSITGPVTVCGPPYRCRPTGEGKTGEKKPEGRDANADQETKKQQNDMPPGNIGNMIRWN